MLLRNINTNKVLEKFTSSRYALNFDGVNDYLQSVNTYTSLWNYKDQPVSIFIRLLNLNLGKKTGFFEHFNTAVINGGRGIFIENTLGVFRFVLRNTFSSNVFEINVSASQTQAFFNGVDDIIQITYDGVPNSISSVEVFLNNNLCTKTMSLANLTADIEPNTFVRIGSLTGFLLDGAIVEFSVTNYVKNAAEIADDFNAGTQLAGAGSFLFRLPLTYPDHITTLSTTTPITETAQGLNMNYSGYLPTLQLGTDLIEFEQANKSVLRKI